MVKQPEKRTIAKPAEVRPVDLKIELVHGIKPETCCNYRITGHAGGVMLVLPPMTHIQDMPR